MGIDRQIAMTIHEHYIVELNGYLQALSRLCGQAYCFGARAYPASEKDIDGFVTGLMAEWSRDEPCQYHGKALINYQDVEENVLNAVFHGVLNLTNMPNEHMREDAKRMIFEDINEYYGLFSTSQDEDGIFHPLIAGSVYELHIVNKVYASSFHYLVKIGAYYVLTFFTKKS